MSDGVTKISKSRKITNGTQSPSCPNIECNYKIHNKEMLVIICTLEEWRHFIKTAQHKVEIRTNHQNLEYFITAQKLNHQQARYSLQLKEKRRTLYGKFGGGIKKERSRCR
jgi:hypothetical protein